MRTAERAPSETAIQKSIIQYLAAVLPRAIVFAVPNAARRTQSGRPMNAIPGLTPGVPDLCLCLPKGRVIWIEVKAPSGRASLPQIAFHGRLHALGHDCFIARSVEDVRNAFAVLGVETRERA